MPICLKNFVVVIIMIVLLLAAVEVTKYRQRDQALKSCHAEKVKLQQNYEQRLQQVYAQQNGAAQKQVSRAMQIAAEAKREAAQALREQDALPGPPGLGRGPAGGAWPSPRLPFNQLTQSLGYLDDWHYVGYVFPKNKDVDKRYPLYARRSPTDRHLYDYYVQDNSRHRVRINLEVPRGQYQLMDGDTIHIDSEPGKWIVRIDVPADLSPLLYQA